MSKSSERSTSVQEQRRFPRIKESCLINFRPVDANEQAKMPDRAASAVMNNISGGGICFRSGSALATDSMLALEVFLPNYPAPVISMGRVAWCEPCKSESGFEVGVEFWWIGWKDELAQAQIRSFITDALKTGST